MAAIFIIIICTFLFGHAAFGYNDKIRNQNLFLEKAKKEKYEESFKIIKRSVGNLNEIGGRNIHADVRTTTETNIVLYSAQGTDVTQDVNVKTITQSYEEGESQHVENSNNAQNNIGLLNQGTSNENFNNLITESNTNNQNNYIGHNKASGTINDIDNSNAISQSAIASSNQSRADSPESALSSSQNQNKNETTDTFATPVASTRQTISSTDETVNLIGGSNLNTSPRNPVENGMNNDIPELTSEEPNVNKSTTYSNNLVSTVQETTIITTSELTTRALNLITTTLQTQLESTANQSSLPTSPGSIVNKNITTTSGPYEPTTKSNGFAVSNNHTVEPLTEKTPEKANTTESIPVSKPYNVTESIPETKTSPEPDTKNDTSTGAPEPVPEPEMENESSTISSEPVPEPEDNSTVAEPETSAVPPSNNTNNNISATPETTVKTMVKTITNITSQTTVLSNNTTITQSNNETGSESSTEPTVELNDNVTKVVTPNPEPSVEPENTNTSNNNSTSSDHSSSGPTPVPEKTSTESSFTKSSTVKPNLTTSNDDQETPIPEIEVTQEPKPHTTTELKITTLSKLETTTTNHESSPKTSVKQVLTTTAQQNNLTTTNSVVAESTAEPENDSSTEQTHIDNTTTALPEPTEEPPGEGEPEPEDENTKSEPEEDEEDSVGKPEFNTNAFAEPGPDWKLAKPVWKEAWEFHVYFFGIIFSVLGLYCMVTLIRLWNMEHLLSKHYFITLHLLVIFVCILRATYLMIDAYNSLGKFPFGLDYFLYSTAFPCLTALFSILFYALLLATRVRVLSKKVQKLWVLVLIVSLHFLLSLTTDIVVGLFTSASVMIFICQVFFIVWGLLMFVGYLMLFQKLYKGAINHQKTMIGSPHEHKNSAGHAYHVKPAKQKYTLGLAVKITFISALFGLAIVGFELYGMFGVYGVFKSGTKPDPWPWWIYHTIVRSLEILICLSVAYVASQPLKYKMKKNLDSKINHYILPCSICCCPHRLDRSEVYSSTISLDYVASETDHLSWLKKMKNKTSSPKAPYPPHTAEKYSDPDATLLVRKIKRTSKPSMLVVEDGFVRIRREDENMPSNQYELDSRSSHSSDINMGPDDQNTGALTNVVNLNYSGHNSGSVLRDDVPGVNFNNYLLQGNVSNNGYTNDNESADETDIDIVVTESEHESDNRDSPEGEGSGQSNKSADIFRPLSMIDLAASMESELERAFHSSAVDETDIISHKSLPTSFDGYNTDSNECALNEHLYDKYCDNAVAGAAANLDSTNYSSDSADDQSKSSAHAQLIRPLVRRCKSDDSHRSNSPKYKHFEKNKYFSVSSVDNLGKDEELNTHFGSNGELRTEL